VRKDEISVELSRGIQPRARPPGMGIPEWTKHVASELLSAHNTADKLPYTIPCTSSTVSFSVNGVPLSAPLPWEMEGGGGDAGCFAVRFHQEGDSVEIKSHSCHSLPTFFLPSLPPGNSEQPYHDNGAQGVPFYVHSLAGGAPYYVGISPRR
jgi:hypothetical protein